MTTNGSTSTGGRGRRRPPPNGIPATREARLLDDLEQLDLEDERRARLDLRRRAAVAVGGVRGTDEAALAADLHLLDAFGPALDHPVERKRDRLAALDRAVEHGAVRQRALIVHLHFVGGRRTRTGAGLQRRDDGAGRRLDRALFRRRLVDVGLPGFALRHRGGGHTRLLEILDLRTVRL